MQKKTILFFLCMVCLTATIRAQSLSDLTLERLSNSVRNQYARTMMEGTYTHRTSEGLVLVSLVSVKNSPTMQRVAQAKAVRNAGEYLQGAITKSVTVYETIDVSSQMIDDKASETAQTYNVSVSSEIVQATTEDSFSRTEERFSESIIQSSITRVGHMEPLTRFVGEGGVMLFAFYMKLTDAVIE